MPFIAYGVFSWIVLSVIIGFIAGAYNRSQILWLLVSLIFSPLIGMALLALCGRLPDMQPRPKETKDMNTGTKVPTLAPGINNTDFVMKM
jgi:hypothetical protein